MEKCFDLFVRCALLIILNENYRIHFVQASDLSNKESQIKNVITKKHQFDTDLNHLVVDRETGNVSFL